MASAADLRDIFSLDKPTPPKPNKIKVAPRKESGISRELYSLIGNSAPTLVAQYARPQFKAKPDLGRPRPKWEWKSFPNSARSDSLQLHHWVKTSGDGATNPGDATKPYPFAKFGTNPAIAYDYSMDEYTRMLEDPDWTREETDYLFSLVKEYDVRFIVIADRYDWPGGKPRNIVDLKARYYAICRKLIKHRPFAGDESARNAAISSYSFDKERETQRRIYLDKLAQRTPEELADEEALYIELQRIAQNERRFQKDRDDLLRTLSGIDCGLGTLRIDDPSSLNDPRRKKKRLENGMEVADSPASATSNNLIALPSPHVAGPSGMGRPKSASVSSTASVTPRVISVGSSSVVIPGPIQVEPIVDTLNCMVQIPAPPSASLSATSTSKSAHKPVHLRSSLFPQPKNNLIPKVNAIVTELGVHPTKLVMPTQANLAKMDELQGAAIGLLEMKKTLDRVEQEIRIAKARLRGPSAGGDDDGEEDGEAEEDADGDVEMVEPTTGDKRGHRRSTSISSSNTTSNQRGGFKRQRRD